MNSQELAIGFAHEQLVNKHKTKRQKQNIQ